MDNAWSSLLGRLWPTATVKQIAVGGNTALFSDLTSNKIVVYDCLVPRKRARIGDDASLIMEGHGALLSAQHQDFALQAGDAQNCRLLCSPTKYI
jgi:hypothetical protein